MDERELVDRYDAAGARAPGGFPPVRWPDLPLTPEDLRRLHEGVLESRIDAAALAFGNGFDAEADAERLEEAWRLDGMQVRFAPEGVYVRARSSVRLTLASEDESDPEPLAEANLEIHGEWCLSFTERHRTRPFVDFMGGTARVQSEASSFEKRLDPFTLMVEPGMALAWGLNGSAGR